MRLVDHQLQTAADILDDLEKVQLANHNRLRQLTRTETDKDGELRGFGMPENQPDVQRISAICEGVDTLVSDAVKNLEKTLRTSPLHPWIKEQRGLGEKQMARLLSAIGDPYIRPEMVYEDGTVEESRPRMVSELWAYTGFHVLQHADNETVGVAPVRRRGAHANWNDDARKRAWLVANSILKAGGSYRKVYDVTREKYADAVHQVPCVRCGPSGKPAQVGSPLNDGHAHARGLRAVAKEVLKDLWVESKRLHEGVAEPLDA